LKPRGGAAAAEAGAPARALSGSDAKLVAACLRGSEEAWASLIDKYKALVFSIPARQGIPRDAAADVFQRVCLLLLAELPHLRQAEALPMWLIRVTARECLRWRRQEHPYAGDQEAEVVLALVPDTAPPIEDVLARAGAEQALREAVAALPPRCRRLVEMLFFEAAPRPYQQVAQSLGLAVGSIGFIRGRCLARLRRELERRGFR
jgi:RNA polymerase sigma factor (sigma-70 family)